MAHLVCMCVHVCRLPVVYLCGCGAIILTCPSPPSPLHHFSVRHRSVSTGKVRPMSLNAAQGAVCEYARERAEHTKDLFVLQQWFFSSRHSLVLFQFAPKKNLFAIFYICSNMLFICLRSGLFTAVV